MNIDFELRLCTIISNPRPGLTPGTALRAVASGINMSVYYIASFKINYFIAQNLGNKAQPRDHDPPKSTLGTRVPSFPKVPWVRGCITIT